MINNKTIGIIVAARINSSRLPGKALKLLNGIPMLCFLLRRLKTSTLADKIILATSDQKGDDLLVELAQSEKIKIFRGDLNDVTERYIDAAEEYKIDIVVRVTGDCPFVNGELVDYCIEEALNSDSFDLCSTKNQYPVGLDVEIYNNESISEIYNNNLLTNEEREHLTLYYYNNQNKYKIVKLLPPKKWQGKGLSYTVDSHIDYNRVSILANKFENELFSIENLVKLEYS